MKRAFEFDVLSPGDGDWEKWYKLSNNDGVSSCPINALTTYQNCSKNRKLF